MPVKSVGFAIGNLRAKENRMLKNSDMVRFASAGSLEELAGLLAEKGIGTGEGGDIPELLSAETRSLWEYLYDCAPDISVFEPFLLENDFHNLKTVLKGVLCGREYERLLIYPAGIDTKIIEKAVCEKRFELLDDFMKTAAERAYRILLKTGDSQLSDCIADAAQMTAQLKRADEIKKPLVLKLVRASVFYGNIKAALRAARAGKGRGFLEECLTETGIVSKKALTGAALAGEKALLDLLASAKELGGGLAAEEYKRSAGNFERFVDNYLLKTASESRYVTIGDEPLVGYMIAKQAEIKNLRIIYSGVKTGQPEEKIRERLRELNG